MVAVRSNPLRARCGRTWSLHGLLFGALLCAGASAGAGHNEPPPPPPGLLPVISGADEAEAAALRQGALKLSDAGRFAEAAQRLITLYERKREPHVLLKAIEQYQRAGDIDSVRTRLAEYAKINPRPGASVQENLMELRSWLQQALAARSSAHSPLRASGSTSGPPVAGSARRTGAGTVPPAEPHPELGRTNLAASGPITPGPIGPPVPGLLDLPKKEDRPRKPVPRWAWGVLGAALGVTVVGVGVGLAVYYNPRRDYSLYPSMVR